MAKKTPLIDTNISGHHSLPAPRQVQKLLPATKQCLETVARYSVAGVTHFIFMLFQPVFPDQIQAFAEDVAPTARG